MASSLDILLCSTDESNVKNNGDEITIRLQHPVTVTPGSRISLQKLLVSHATKGPIWVALDEGEANVLSDGKMSRILGVYHCEGSKTLTTSFPPSSIALNLRSPVLSSLTLRLFNPQTKAPITFHKDPLVVAHLRLNPM